MFATSHRIERWPDETGRCLMGDSVHPSARITIGAGNKHHFCMSRPIEMTFAANP
jgi:hypothetical protein